MKRSAKRKSRESGRGIVLAEIRNVRQRGRSERKDERDGGLRAQAAAD
jgi:hypothetical protein